MNEVTRLKYQAAATGQPPSQNSAFFFVTRGLRIGVGPFGVK
jgi:hypothetical protein